MATTYLVSTLSLDSGYTLTPERYSVDRVNREQQGKSIIEFCSIEKDTISSKKASPDIRYMVLDTGDVKEGFIRYKPTVDHSEIGSTKKILKVGDVIVSRLRPYLRQVGYVDKLLFESLPTGTELICSTEFFVLRAHTNIAYLTAFLLTDQVQSVLSSSQEGGHHPRFNKITLESITLPKAFYENIESISVSFEASINSIRTGEMAIRNQLQSINSKFS